MKAGRPLDSQKHTTLTATQPWVAEGMSRRTWFRRRAEKNTSRGRPLKGEAPRLKPMPKDGEMIPREPYISIAADMPVPEKEFVLPDHRDRARHDGLHLADLLLLSICEVETDPEKLFEAVKTWRRTKENFKRTEKSND
jgi:hypothetical protein